MRVRSRLLLLGVLLASGVSIAQETPSPDPQRLKDAAEAFDDASKAFQGGRYEDAARRFEDADRLAPSPAALSNALRARQAARQGAASVTLAAAALERYPDDKVLRDLAQKVMKSSEKLYHRLQVRCAPACVLSIDGKLLVAGDATPGQVIYLEPGGHAVSAGWSSGRTRSAKVEALRGGTSQTTLEAPALPPPPASSSASLPPSPLPSASTPSALPAASSAPPPSAGLSPWFALAGAGVTVVLGGVAIWSGLDTRSSPGPDRVREACAGQSRDCPLFQDGLSKERRTNALFIATGVVGVATGVVALFTDWSAAPLGSKTETARARTGPWVAPASGGVALGVNGVFLTPWRHRSDPSLLLRAGGAGR